MPAAAYSRDLEIASIFTGKALSVGNRTALGGSDFPYGEGWYRARMRVGIVVTIGTGAGAIAEGELNFIKNILLVTDRGEEIINCPGRELYKFGVILSGSPPRKDAIAAASATYYVDLPVHFADMKAKRPEDTLLDTGRYNQIRLEITLGTVADLFTAPGTATVTATFDMEVERTKGLVPTEGGPPMPGAPGGLGAQPILHVQYGYAPPVDASSVTNIDLERSADLAYKRLLIHSSSSGTAGVPFSGANADDVQAQSSLRDQSGFIFQTRIHEMVQNENKDFYSLESVLAGYEVFDFAKDGSNMSSLYSQDRSRLQYVWSNKAGVAANDIVTVGYQAVRSLK